MLTSDVHLVQGTRPSQMIANVKDFKRYLNVVTVASDGLLVAVVTTDTASGFKALVNDPRLHQHKNT